MICPRFKFFLALYNVIRCCEFLFLSSFFFVSHCLVSCCISGVFSVFRCHDDESKTTILNEYFVSQTRLTNPFNDNLSYDIADETNTPTLNTVLINPDNIIKCITNLNAGKACGPDGIGNYVLKNCADGLAMPISILAEHSINSGTFPSSWKTSNAVPIFKKDDKSVVSNHRPISLLSCTSKIVERLVYNELYDFCHLLTLSFCPKYNKKNHKKKFECNGTIFRGASWALMLAWKLRKLHVL